MLSRWVRWTIWAAVAAVAVLTVRWWVVGLLWLAVPGGILGTVLIMAAVFSPWGTFRGEGRGQ